MMTAMFRAALHLYPRDHRREFGTEMIEVFEKGRQAAAAIGAASLIVFYAREAFGLTADIARTHCSTARREETWAGSLEASLIASALYTLSVMSAHELGLWGFFSPVTYALAIGLIIAVSWTTGRTLRLIRGPRTFGRIVVAVVFSIGVAPVSLRALEDARISALRPGGEMPSFALPGIQVATARGDGESPHASGLTFTRVVTLPGGIVTLVHHRDPAAPPYLVLGAVLAALMAFVSRRRLSW